MSLLLNLAGRAILAISRMRDLPNHGHRSAPAAASSPHPWLGGWVLPLY
jgi:hypothetical protein